MRLTKRDKLILIARLRRLKRAKHGHAPSARDILEDARSPDSPFHKYFKWDDAVAAKLHYYDKVVAAMNAFALRIYFPPK